MIERYNFSEIEKKWQEKWEKEDTFKVTEDGDKEKYYVLEMFIRLGQRGGHVSS